MNKGRLDFYWSDAIHHNESFVPGDVNSDNFGQSSVGLALLSSHLHGIMEHLMLPSLNTWRGFDVLEFGAFYKLSNNNHKQNMCRFILQVT